MQRPSPKRQRLHQRPKQGLTGQARDAGATVVHCHYRQQAPGLGRFPTWDPDIVAEIDATIRAKVPDLIINMSTGVIGSDVSAQLDCLRRIRPEVAALGFPVDPAKRTWGMMVDAYRKRWW